MLRVIFVLKKYVLDVIVESYAHHRHAQIDTYIHTYKHTYKRTYTPVHTRGRTYNLTHIPPHHRRSRELSKIYLAKVMGKFPLSSDSTEMGAMEDHLARQFSNGDAGYDVSECVSV